MILKYPNKGILTAFIFLLAFSANAQLEVTNSTDADELAQLLAGPGVVVSNAFLTCADSSSGYFSNGNNTNLGLSEGVVLTSGSATGVAGPNDQGGFTGQTDAYYGGFPGDPDLDQIPGVLGTNDACGLEFDLTTSCADTITFNYVFGSEEYLEFVGSFNDVFALYVTGENPGGGMYNNENVALIPGTTTTVSINNVNDYTNPAYYVNNGDGNCYGGYMPPECTDPFYIQYDGFTVVLEAKFAIVPSTDYHLKIVVADDLDTALDSGVFIEAGSITANSISVEANTSITGFNQAVEGCVDGIINFALNEPLGDTLVLNYLIDGTAENGIDYVDGATGNPLIDSIIIYPGDTNAIIIIQPLLDALDSEGVETIIIGVIDTCGVAADSVELEIIDEIEIFVNIADTAICAGSPVQLEATGAQNYLWGPTIGLSDPEIANPIASPDITTTYTVNGSVGPCIDIETIQVNVFDGPIVNLEEHFTICSGDSVQLDASTSTGIEAFEWMPITYLDNFASLSPYASPPTSMWYYFEAEDAGQCTELDSVFVEVIETVEADAGNDETICQGQFVNLMATGGSDYSWSPNTGLSCDDCDEPIANPTETTEYVVEVSISGSCAKTDTVLISVNTFDLDAGEDFEFCNSGEATIGPSEIDASLSYEWQGDDGSVLVGSNPTVSIETGEDNSSVSVTYTLTATDDAGCSATDQVVVAALGQPLISAGVNDTIFQGETAILTAGGGGVNGSYQWSPAELVFEPNSQITSVRPDETTEFIVTGTTDDGCAGIDTVLVFVIPLPYVVVPNAFSPNNDGQNDFILPHYSKIEALSVFRIWNRWGKLVYENNGDMSQGWDGRYNNQNQEIGVYSYYLEAIGEDLELPLQYKGNITLVR